MLKNMRLEIENRIDERKRRIVPSSSSSLTLSPGMVEGRGRGGGGIINRSVYESRRG